MSTYNSAQAQISDTVSEGKKRGRNSYNTLPSSFLCVCVCVLFAPCLIFLILSWVQFQILGDYQAMCFVACVRERPAHRRSLFTFTTRTISLLKISPFAASSAPLSRHCYPHLSPFPRPDTASHQADANIRPPLTVPAAIARLYEADTCTAHTCAWRCSLKKHSQQGCCVPSQHSALKQK